MNKSQSHNKSNRNMRDEYRGGEDYARKPRKAAAQQGHRSKLNQKQLERMAYEFA